MSATPEVHSADSQDLARFGYKQELRRALGVYSSFAVAFSYISPSTGIFTLFILGLGLAGPAFFWSWPIVVVAVAESLVPLGSGVAPEDAVATFVAIPVDAAAMVNAHENAAPLGSGSGPLQSKNFPPTLTLGVAPPVVAPATIEALFNAGGIGSWMTGSVDEFGPRFVAVSVYVRRSPTLAAALSTAFIAERSAEACTQLPVIETT